MKKKAEYYLLLQFVWQSYMTFKCDVPGLFQMTLIIQNKFTHILVQ